MEGLFPVAFLDAPQVLNATVTHIPGSGSAPLQVIANSGNQIAYAIEYIDSTGDYIGVYIGSAGNEVLKTIIGGGAAHSTVRVLIPVSSRVSFRSITATAITNGFVSMALLGMGVR